MSATEATEPLAMFSPKDDTLDMYQRLVERVLTEAAVAALKFENVGAWTLQGLGMLRTYLGEDKQVRLHVWDDRYIAEPTPSELHTHPWHMYSYVVAGEVRNTRFTIPTPAYSLHDSEVFLYSERNAEYMKQTIFCGIGGGLCGDPEHAVLRAEDEEVYTAGQVYKQHAEEIHKSNPLRGTVTLVTRGFGEDVDHAEVYWPAGEEWITAEPRPATPEEVSDICTLALQTWF